jgi:hypothetical protein
MKPIKWKVGNNTWQVELDDWQDDETREPIYTIRECGMEYDSIQNVLSIYEEDIRPLINALLKLEKEIVK